MSSPNKKLIRQIIDATNVRNMAAIEQLTSPSVYLIWKQTLDWVNTVWPDIQLTLVDIIEEGDKVWCRVHTAGTLIAEWENIPASPDAGKRWENPGVWFMRVEDGRIVASEMLFDGLNHIKQLGGKVTI